MYDNMICSNSDTCNTVKGQHKGVMKHLCDHQPALINFGCICHLKSLTIKAACKTLPINVDINIHFYLSVKRKEEFKSFCNFVDVTCKKILMHVETRWLNLLQVIVHVLELWLVFATGKQRNRVSEYNQGPTMQQNKVVLALSGFPVAHHQFFQCCLSSCHIYNDSSSS